MRVQRIYTTKQGGVMKVIEIPEYKSFNGAIPKQISFRSLTHLAEEFYFEIMVSEAVKDSVPLRQEVLFIEGIGFGEGFFYQYNEYVNCFDLVRQFKCKGNWEETEEWSVLYHEALRSLADEHGLDAKTYITAITSSYQRLKLKPESIDDDYPAA